MILAPIRVDAHPEALYRTACKDDGHGEANHVECGEDNQSPNRTDEQFIEISVSQPEVEEENRNANQSGYHKVSYVADKVKLIAF